MRKSMCVWVLQMPAATYGFRSASPRRALLQLHVWRAGTPAARPHRECRGQGSPAPAAPEEATTRSVCCSE